MRLHHIDDARAAGIGRQLDKHAADIDGVSVANSHLWDQTPDRQAGRRTFDAATLKDTRTGIVAPGISDKPLAIHTPIGRALGQFQSYTFAWPCRRHEATGNWCLVYGVRLGDDALGETGLLRRTTYLSQVQSTGMSDKLD
jgi:hypothetical protein